MVYHHHGSNIKAGLINKLNVLYSKSIYKLEALLPNGYQNLHLCKTTNHSIEVPNILRRTKADPTAILNYPTKCNRAQTEF